MTVVSATDRAALWGTQKTQTTDSLLGQRKRVCFCLCFSTLCVLAITNCLLQSTREVIQCINKPAQRMLGLFVYVEETLSSSFHGRGTSLAAMASPASLPSENRRKCKKTRHELLCVTLNYICSEINANIDKETTSTSGNN